MDRVEFAGVVISEKEGVRSVLDVGCRDGHLREFLGAGVSYAGADLVQNLAGSVAYVGDINEIEIGRRFDCVVACDILEHVEQPSALLAKLFGYSSGFTVVSLPNCYDLKSRYAFCFRGRLGGKYRFVYPEPIDRHRWLLNVDQAFAFLQALANEHGQVVDFRLMRYGDFHSSRLRSRAAALLGWILPRALGVHTIFAVFTPLVPLSDAQAPA